MLELPFFLGMQHPCHTSPPVPTGRVSLECCVLTGNPPTLDTSVAGVQQGFLEMVERVPKSPDQVLSIYLEF